MLRRWIRHRKKRPSNLFAGIVLVSITASNLLGILLFQSTSNMPIFNKNQPVRGANDLVPIPAYGETSSTRNKDIPPTVATERIAGTNFFFNVTRGHLDSRREYKVHDFVVYGDDWQNISSKYSVCLATQTSLDRLYWLLEVAQSWTGPVSVSVFVPGLDAQLAEAYIVFLRMCSSNIRKHTSFHFAYPTNIVPDKGFDQSYLKGFHCNRAKEVLLKLMDHKKFWLHTTPRQLLYPQNLLRNIARRGCSTEYHFLTDIDVVPKPNLAYDLNVFLASPKPCSKCVFVVPTYEALESESIPASKKALLQLVKNRKAQPFHFTVFIHNQYASNHSVWEKLPDRTTVEAAYKVTNYEFFYEPFYVGDRGVPWHDERFVGYGFTRNTQVFETHIAGYEFWVLNPVFAVHRGIQTRKARTQWRERQNVRNRKVFVVFKREVLEKYSRMKKTTTSL